MTHLGSKSERYMTGLSCSSTRGGPRASSSQRPVLGKTPWGEGVVRRASLGSGSAVLTSALGRCRVGLRALKADLQCASCHSKACCFWGLEDPTPFPTPVLGPRAPRWSWVTESGRGPPLPSVSPHRLAGPTWGLFSRGSSQSPLCCVLSITSAGCGRRLSPWNRLTTAQEGEQP